MISYVMMALGMFRFGVYNSSYEQTTRTANFRWSKLDRVGRAPALQYLGPDADTVSIEGVIYPHFRGGLHQVKLMREQAKIGRAMMMVDGLGWVFERWVITDVMEKKFYFMQDGAPRKIEFILTLKAYGGDGF